MFYEWIFKIGNEEYSVISDSVRNNALAELALAAIPHLEGTTPEYRIRKIRALEPTFVRRRLTNKEPVDIGKL